MSGWQLSEKWGWQMSQKGGWQMSQNRGWQMSGWHMYHIRSVHHLVPFLLKRCDQTGATIDTSWGQLMVSPHGGDNVLAQV